MFNLKNRLNFFFLICISSLFIFLLYQDGVLTLSNAEYYNIYDATPDEILFYREIQLLATFISNGDLNNIVNYGMPYGYGFIYWFFSAIIYLVLPEFNGVDLFYYKFIFWLIKVVSFLLPLIFLPQLKKIQPRIVYLFLILSCASFTFYGKHISPEPVILLFTIIGMIFLINSQFSINKYYYLSFFFISSAFLIKPTVWPLFLFCIIIGGEDFRRSAFSFKKVVKVCLSFLLPFFITIIPIVTDQGFERFTLWSTKNYERTFSYTNFINWVFQSNKTWDLIPISGLSGYLGIAFCLVLILFSFFSNCRVKRYNLLYCMAFSGFLGVGSITFFSGYLDWYLWPSAMMIIIPVAMLFSSNQTKKVFFRLCLGFVILYSFSYQEQEKRIKLRKYVLNEQYISSINANASLDYIIKNYGEKAVVATDFLVGLDNSMYRHITLLRFRDLLTINLLNNSKEGSLRKAVLKEIIFDESLAKMLKEISYVLLNDDLISKDTKALAGFMYKNDHCIALDSSHFYKVKEIGNISIFKYTKLSCN